MLKYITIRQCPLIIVAIHLYVQLEVMYSLIKMV